MWGFSPAQSQTLRLALALLLGVASFTSAALAATGSAPFIADDPKSDDIEQILVDPDAPPEDPLAELTPDRNSLYTESREFRSPISGELFSAPVLRQSVPINSYDTDGCPHGPINILAYAVVIDPASGYVAPPSSFGNPVKFTKEELSQLLGAPRFDHPGSTLPWEGAFAWEKLENMAKLAKSNRAASQLQAQWWLAAAWSVRLDVSGGGNSFDQEVLDLFAGLPEAPYDPYHDRLPRELSAARHYENLRANGQLVNVDPAHLDLALAWLYRSRGELAAASHYLGAAKQADSTIVKAGELYSLLQNSIKLEQEYLSKAEDLLLTAWNSGSWGKGRDGNAAMQLAELARRQGHLRQACLWAFQAETLDRGELDQQMLDSLLASCSGRGY